jgi:hypothetical protein
MRTTVILACLFSGCAVTPDRGQITMDKVIDLDARALDGTRVGVRLEWFR